jgi:hypothetical protein
LTAGDYFVSVTDARGCKVVSDKVTVNDPKEITINLGDDLTLCKDQTYMIDGTLASDSKATYVWTSSADSKFTSKQPQITVSEPSTYTVVITTSLGCIITDSIIIKKDKLEIDASFASSTQLFKNEKSVIVDISFPLPDSIEWILPKEAIVHEKNKDLVEISFKEPGDYDIGLITRRGDCTAFETKKVFVTNEEFVVEEEKRTKKFDLTIYPNPTDGDFKIDVIFEKEQSMKVKIYDLNNILHYESVMSSGLKEYSLPVALKNVSRGTYFILFESTVGSEVRKLIVK